MAYAPKKVLTLRESVIEAGPASKATGMFLVDVMDNPNSVRPQLWEVLYRYVVEAEDPLNPFHTRRGEMVAWLLPEEGLFAELVERAAAILNGEEPTLYAEAFIRVFGAMFSNPLAKDPHNELAMRGVFATLPLEQQKKIVRTMSIPPSLVLGLLNEEVIPTHRRNNSEYSIKPQFRLLPNRF